MAERKGIEVSIAVAETAAACDCDVVAAYPITPQTHVVEHLAELVADGHLDAEFIPVESEHAAMSACCGSSAAGARTFTATSSQGLALMHEILFIAANLRLPMVMVVANRALSAPINIWNDHSDVMTERDVGWVQIFAESGQEAADLVIQAFRVSEDPRVSLPIMVHFDGFILSHVIEPIEMLDRAEIKRFLPDFRPIHRLDVDKPISMGPVGMPGVYTEAKMAGEAVLRGSYGPICETLAAFGKEFGRTYQPVESYRTEGAEVLFVTMGSISETAMTWIDTQREKGEKVGLVRFRLWRPLPADDFKAAIRGAKVLSVVDRHFSPGGPGGPVAQEIKYLLYGDPDAPKIVESVAGLGGRDIGPDDFQSMYDKCKAVLGGAPVPPFELIQVRGGHYGEV
ncbi:MAG TPA: transketolase C-terminal domain-containing protein [Polyangia bacterium]|nr:transketolase C-terminal domain-containing protein [Polyangia bacterium]